MKKTTQKLKLRSETVRTLTADSLVRAHGGALLAGGGYAIVSANCIMATQGDACGYTKNYTYAC